MGYTYLEISEVTPAEDGLLRVLHDTLLSGIVPWAAVETALAGKDVLRLIGHLEGNPAAFLVASGDGESRDSFVIAAYGVLPDYRHQGAARRMIEQAAAFARSRNYASVKINGLAM